MKAITRFVLAALITSGVAWAGESDAEGCADHPLFTRMAGYHIVRCESAEFDARPFMDAKGKETSVEGRVTELYYTLDEGQKDRSRVQIARNYENAIKKIGGSLVYSYDDYGMSYFAAKKDGKAVWALVNAYNPHDFWIKIILKEEMRQDVVADASAFADGLKATGHIAVYGIYFDTGKSDVKSESDAALKEIAKLLAQNSSLKLYVVGHTDSVGQFDANMKLSQARAEAAAKALVTKHGVAATRLRAVGAGPTSPVASNATEDGKAKNRRVELVEQ